MESFSSESDSFEWEETMRQPLGQNFNDVNIYDEMLMSSELSGSISLEDEDAESQDVTPLYGYVNDNNNNNFQEPLDVFKEVGGATVPILGKRIQLLQFALTYPQCDVLPSTALSNIIAHFNNMPQTISYCVVAREPHKDGNNHLHVALKLSEKLRYTDQSGKYWDFVTKQHGNYQRMKRPTSWVGYCIKGGNFVCSEGFDPQLFCSATSKKRSYVSEVIAKEIIANEKDLNQLVEEYPGFMIMQLKKVQHFVDFMGRQREKRRKLLELPYFDVSGLSRQSQTVYKWLLTISSGHFIAEVEHLRIQGPTGIGKTSLVLAINQFFRLYSMPLSEDWYCTFNDHAYDIVVFDEYKAQKTLTFLNRFCDGAYHPLKRKGQEMYLHSKRLPCLMLSNYSWENSYTKAKDSPTFPATLRRWQVVEYAQECDLLDLCAVLTAVRGPGEHELPQD